MAKRKQTDDNTGWRSRYKLLEKQFDSGGNASIHRVQSKADSSVCALKELKQETRERKTRFLHEIEIMSAYWRTIEGIMPVLDSSQDQLWYTMPIAQPILAHITGTGSTPQDIARGILQLCRTLSPLHAQGISHRDIKPANLYHYNGRYFLGDFGLVDFPDKPENLTKSNRGLGAIFTIAPEMKRNPKEADGRMGDVFSLAKTMWMLLTKDELGFDGVYDFRDASHGLRFREPFKDLHLVELEELLADATSHTPALRPDIDSFAQRLEHWLEVLADFELSQASSWRFLNRQLFGAGTPPASAVWRDAGDIIGVLNTVGALSAYNHMLFSDHGGLDFVCAETTGEAGCIAITADPFGALYVVKPGALYYESFPGDSAWSYFLLTLDELPPIFDSTRSDSESLVEDFPGHYVSARYAGYGVYDYDSGEPLPAEARTVERYLRGAFLFVLKNAPYNGIPSTYDGRHGMCSPAEFRTYMDRLRTIYNDVKEKDIPDSVILGHAAFSRNPFAKEPPLETTDWKAKRAQYKALEAYIADHWHTWRFSHLPGLSPRQGRLAFRLTFQDDADSPFLRESAPRYLCHDGYLRALELEQMQMAFQTADRETAIQIGQQCEAQLREICTSSGFDSSLLLESANFKITFEKTAAPTHLFTRAELEQAMRNADDRQHNLLVIDEDGHVKIIQDTAAGPLYPVWHKTWCAGSLHVGKYSNLPTLDETYLTSLQGWLFYLQKGKRISVDYMRENRKEADLIAQIKAHY